MNFKININVYVLMSFILKVAGVLCLVLSLDEIGIFSIVPIAIGVSLFTLGDRLYVYYKD